MVHTKSMSMAKTKIVSVLELEMASRMVSLEALLRGSRRAAFLARSFRVTYRAGAISIPFPWRKKAFPTNHHIFRPLC
jgi:hypothetical protein